MGAGRRIALSSDTAFRGCRPAAAFGSIEGFQLQVTSRVPSARVPIADGRMLSTALACALLAACATSSEPAAPTVVRTRAPVAYEKTINNYLAFRLRPQKNTRVSVAAPEPGDCPIDGTPSSIRGWVVPVTHETFSGELNNKDTIRVTAKPYWFWFNGDTIAGITPRADLCPGIVSAFEDPAKSRPPTTTVVAPVTPVAARTEPVEPPPAKRTAKGAKKKPASSTAGKQANAPTRPKEPAPPKPLE
jgi:hypothetical protein